MVALAEASLANIRIARPSAESADDRETGPTTHPKSTVFADPDAVLGDERRLQDRAYKLWRELGGDDEVAAIEDLRPVERGEIGSHGILIDLTMGIAEPTIAYLGEKLAEVCGKADYFLLREIPGRSLLGRLTEHCLDVVAHRAPVGFEAEFVDARGRFLLYRSMLLPFSSDGRSVDFVYGVISWKEEAVTQTPAAPPVMPDPLPAEPAEPAEIPEPPAALAARPTKSLAQALAEARRNAALARANKQRGG